MSLYTRHKVATLKGKVVRIGAFSHHDNGALIFTLQIETNPPQKFYLDPLVANPFDIQVDWSLTMPGDDVELTFEETPCTGRLINFRNRRLSPAVPALRMDLQLVRQG